MARTTLITLLMLAAFAASPAHAQFPNIFDSIFGNPPRPPADIPSGPRPEPQYIPPSGGLPPGPPPTRRGPREGVQTQPLPPPPGSTSAPTPARGYPPDTAAVPPAGPRQPRSAPPAVPPPPQNNEAMDEPPAHRIANPTAVFAGLDKITGRIISFDVAIGETVRFGALEVTPRACYTRPPTEQPRTDAFIEVDELTLQGELRRIFTGWMFAASPGLNAVEHPIYDIWLTDCKGGKDPTVTAEAPVAQNPPPPPPRPAPRPQQRRAAPQQLPPPPALPQR